MRAPRSKVTYLDGSTKIAMVTPRVKVQLEEKMGGLTSSQKRFRASAYGTWLALNLAGDEAMGYDEWLTKVEHIEDVVSKMNPCSVCGKTEGCAVLPIDPDDDDSDLAVLYHEPPTLIEDADPTPPVASTAV